MMCRTKNRWAARIALAWLGAAWLVPLAHGQLAITEAMSSASARLGTNVVTNLSDFWELTNFGTNEIDLSGYRWNDSAGGWGVADPAPFRDLRIGPGESIIFVESNAVDMATAGAFREWWGLSDDVEIVLYINNGLSATRDGIRLWGPGETEGEVVDSVDFGEARQGSTFTYHADTGLFGYYSVEGVGRAFRAATRDDIGSPGVVTGPVQLQFLSELTDVSVCAGVDATFSILAGGFPKPRYQWYFNGNAVAGQTEATLVISNAHAGNAGNYFVEISNGFEVRRSHEVSLSINTNLTPPLAFAPFGDVAVLIGETARFSVVACASPPAAYQWFTNGVAIPGADDRRLEVPNALLEMSGTEVCVEIVNALGSTNLCARLTVSPRPRLKFTEVMALSSTNCQGHGDWFEITNHGTNAVNMFGYRFATGNDRPPSLEGAFEITNSVILRPGESAIFVERITPLAFQDWWGWRAIAPGVPFISYFGHGLRQTGDEIYLWSAGAEDPADYIDGVAFAASTNGVSKYFDDDVCWQGCDNVVHERGAFQAAGCNDVGSPGYIENSPPRLLSIARTGSGVILQWSAITGRTYRLKSAGQPNGPNWVSIATQQANASVVSIIDPITTASQRFYMVEEVR